MDRFLLINDRVVPRERASISPLDRGFLYGEGVFETVRVERGHPLWAHAHARRMRRGARALGIATDRLTVRTFGRAIRRLCAAEDAMEAVARVTLSAGEPSSDPTWICALRPLPETLPSVELELAATPRTPDPLRHSIKATSYLESLLATRAAMRNGAFDSIFVDPEGVIAEGGRCNLFFVDPDGSLHTPSLDCGVLPGIMRARVLRLERLAGNTPLERKIHMDELSSFQECFVTSSVRGIVPVQRLSAVRFAAKPPAPGDSRRRDDGRERGGRRLPGPRTKALQALLAAENDRMHRRLNAVLDGEKLDHLQ